MKNTKLHIPYWRARGLLKVSGSKVKPIVRHWNGEHQVVPGRIVINDELIVRADVLAE
jgi:hypothetical protein